MNKIAIYPGTFDPITYGHIDVIKKALKLFDKIVVGVSNVSNKNYLFSSEERIEIVNKALFKDLKLNKKTFVFEKKNYKAMIIGLAFITLGFILMSGGGSEDPNVFNPEIYNFRRIKLAPTLVLIGFGIQVYAILLNPNKKK